MSRFGFYWVLSITGLLVFIIGAYTLNRLHNLGAFTRIEAENGHTLEIIAKVPGPEDMELDREDGLLYFISSNPCSNHPERGGLYYIQLDQPNQEAHAFKFDKPWDFHPHGLSYLRGKYDKYLFTNNHREDGTHSVEIFKIIDEDELQHLATIRGSELTSPNDLLAVGPTQFYVTNDGRAHDRFTRSMDTFLGRNTGNVLFYNGIEFSRVVDNLEFPNGIALKTSSKQVFIGETLSGFIKIYQMEGNYNLKFVDNFYAGVGIDNISFDEQSGLLAALHPNLLALSRHMKNPKILSPSKVIHIPNHSWQGKVMYQHSGTDISGISTAVSYNGYIYLGAVCDEILVKIDSIDY